jgi:PIN domain nuclease of toxin-antitoxin system
VTVALDAFGLIALARDEAGADEVEAILRREQVEMTTINLAEALDVLQRVHGLSEARLETVTGPLFEDAIALRPVDERLARHAAALRARHYRRRDSELSLADCVLLAAALDAGAMATADPPLARAARAEGVEVRPVPDSRGRRP